MCAAVGAILALALCLLAPSVARACTLDNVASISANGERAILATSQPQSGHLWAPFNFAQAYGVGARVTLDEARSDLERSLPAPMLATPFRWVLGDGSTIRGMSAAHRYTRRGNYLVRVYAYAASRAQWVLFDSALIRIVPNSQLLQANLGYNALRGLDLVFSWLSRLFTIALALLLIYAVASHLRSRGRAPAPEREGES